jgi:hypothetical protein
MCKHTQHSHSLSLSVTNPPRISRLYCLLTAHENLWTKILKFGVEGLFFGESLIIVIAWNWYCNSFICSHQRTGLVETLDIPVSELYNVFSDVYYVIFSTYLLWTFIFLWLLYIIFVTLKLWVWLKMMVEISMWLCKTWICVMDLTCILL